MTKKILKIFLISFLPIYLFVVFFVFNEKPNDEICRDISINIKDSIETPFLKLSDVKRQIKTLNPNPVGLKFSEINTYEIKKEHEKNRIIKEAVCYKTPSGTLRIDIYQRNPIIRVLGVSGNYYIDDLGEIMPVSYNFTAHLPIATGYVSKELAKSDLYKFALYINKDRFWKAQIEQINITSSNEVELIPKVGDQTIFLGSFDDFENKLDNLMLFYKKGLNKRGWNIYKTISLKYDNQVIGAK